MRNSTTERSVAKPGFEKLLDPEVFDQYRQAGFEPFAIIRSVAAENSRAARNLLENPEHYKAVPVNLSYAEGSVCCGGLTCLFRRIR